MSQYNGTLIDSLIALVDRVMSRNRKPTIKTEQHYSDQWSAVDDNTYDGPGSPVGWGHTEQEAIADLREQLDLCSYCGEPATKMLDDVQVCKDCYDVSKLTWAEYYGEVN